MLDEAEFGLSLDLPSRTEIRAAMAELDAEARDDEDAYPFGFTDEDTFETTVMTASKILETAGARFTMSGFGNSRWPLELSYDGSMIIEDLPHFMPDLIDPPEGGAVLQLCGQGVETDLIFEPAEDDLRISCTSRAVWIDSDIVHYVAELNVLLIFNRLARTFAFGLEMMDAEVANRPPFPSWRAMFVGGTGS